MVGGADSRGVSGIGVASTHSSSSRSVKADEIVSDEKSIAAGLSLLCVTVAVGPAAALGVMGPTGSSLGSAAAAALAALGGCA